MLRNTGDPILETHQHPKLEDHNDLSDVVVASRLRVPELKQFNRVVGALTRQSGLPYYRQLSIRILFQQIGVMLGPCVVFGRSIGIASSLMVRTFAWVGRKKATKSINYQRRKTSYHQIRNTHCNRHFRSSVDKVFGEKTLLSMVLRQRALATRTT